MTFFWKELLYPYIWQTEFVYLETVQRILVSPVVHDMKMNYRWHQRLLLYPEDAGSTFLRNITTYLRNCMAWFWKTLVFGIRTYFLLSGTCRVWCIPRDLLVLVLQPTAILMEVIQLFETAVWRRGWGLWMPPELFSTKWRRVNFCLFREPNPSSAVFQSVSWSLTSKQK
jgi:hypothetical protein